MRALTLAPTRYANGVIPGGRWVQVAYLLTDFFFIAIDAYAAFSIRFVPDWFSNLVGGGPLLFSEYHLVDEYLAFLLLYAGLTVLACQSQDLYRTPRSLSPLEEGLAVTRAVGLATLLLAAFIYISGVKTVSRFVVGLCGVLNVLTLTAWRLWKRHQVERRLAAGIGARNILIVGAGAVGQELARILGENKRFGFVVKGFLDPDLSAHPRVLGDPRELSRIARAHFVDEIFITVPSNHELVKELALEARRQRLDVSVIPEMYEGLAWRAPLHYLGDFPLMPLHQEPIPALALLAKRLLDITCSLVGLVLLSPLLAAIALAIKLDSPGPVLYRSPRVGKKGRRFDCYKFRTMVYNADALKEQLRHLNEREGPFFKIANDPRLTRVGVLLRKFSLDELPQLWNVLHGDMSLVGPRPHPLDDYEQYDLEHLRRLDVTPGITGLWQVSARRDPSFEKNIAFDLEYIENWNLWMDLKILLRTVPIVLRGSGQ